MLSSHRSVPLGLTAVLIAALTPTVALAGKKAVSGGQTLQVKATLTPARAAARQVTLHLQVKTGATVPGRQAPGHTDKIILVFPAGMRVDPTAVPACRRSTIDQAHHDPSACPANTKVGAGTLSVNAAPLIAHPIPAKVTFYNAVNDRGEGQPAGTRNLIMLVKTALGIKTAYAFRVTRAPGARVKLIAELAKPPKPGYTPGDFSLENVNITLVGHGPRPYLTNPRACHGGWLFAITLTNYYGVRSITATDRAGCSS